MYVLEELWRDCFAPNTKQAKSKSEYDRLTQSLANRKEHIMGELSDDGRAAFERFERAKGTLAEISEEDTFIEGFRMGARMMLDVLGTHQRQFE